MFSIQKSLNVDHHINRRKKKNLMIMSTDAKKAFEVQHPFMIKTLRNLGIKGNFLNSVKDIYKKPTTNIIFKTGCLLPLKIIQLGHLPKMSTAATSSQHCTESSIQSN